MRTRRIALRAGENKTVEFRVAASRFSYIDTEGRRVTGG
jgi:Fibronectin type III-like domain